MFENTLLETSAARPARARATAVSLSLQAAALVAVFAFPLVFPATLRPEIKRAGVPLFYAVPKAVPIFIDKVTNDRVPSSPTQQTITVPDTRLIFIPSKGTGKKRDSSETDPSICVSPCIPQVGNGGDTNVIASIGNTTGSIVRLDPPKRVRISQMEPGAILRRIQPQYPITAKATQTQGAVVLHAIIARDGTMQSVQVIAGHPLLVEAARQAVAQWRYRPFLLNGSAVEVETQITVNFKLANQ